MSKRHTARLSNDESPQLEPCRLQWGTKTHSGTNLCIHVLVVSIDKFLRRWVVWSKGLTLGESQNVVGSSLPACAVSLERYSTGESFLGRSWTLPSCTALYCTRGNYLWSGQPLHLIGRLDPLWPRAEPAATSPTPASTFWATADR